MIIASPSSVYVDLKQPHINVRLFQVVLRLSRTLLSLFHPPRKKVFASCEAVWTKPLKVWKLKVWGVEWITQHIFFTWMSEDKKNHLSNLWKQKVSLIKDKTKRKTLKTSQLGATPKAELHRSRMLWWWSGPLQLGYFIRMTHLVLDHDCTYETHLLPRLFIISEHNNKYFWPAAINSDLNQSLHSGAALQRAENTFWLWMDEQTPNFEVHKLDVMLLYRSHTVCMFMLMQWLIRWERVCSGVMS